MSLMWVGFLLLMFIEQVCYSWFFRYPYRYGIPVFWMRPKVPEMLDWSEWSDLFAISNKVVTSIQEETREVYFREKVFWLWKKWCFLAGQAKYNKSPVIIIRVGWVNAVIVGVIVWGVLSPESSFGDKFWLVLLLFAFAIYPCIRFSRKYKAVMGKFHH